jgi:DNA-binding protein Fis
MLGSPYEHIIEDTMVKAAYNYCHNNQLQTTKLLGVSRNIIREKLIKMGAINALR